LLLLVAVAVAQGEAAARVDTVSFLHRLWNLQQTTQSPLVLEALVVLT
jgi:hypothetical protein